MNWASIWPTVTGLSLDRYSPRTAVSSSLGNDSAVELEHEHKNCAKLAEHELGTLRHERLLVCSFE